MSNQTVLQELTQLIGEIDFDSEHYYNLYFESLEELPPQDVSAEVWTNLSTLTADITKLRGEFARLRRGVEQLRMPAIEAVGLDGVAERLRGLELRLKPVVDAIGKRDPDAGIVTRLLKDLLAVVDGIERVFELQRNQPQTISENMRVGMESLYRLLLDTLKRYGLERMKLDVGDKFDPELQMAISTEINNELGSGCVSQILVSGYLLEGKLLRTAQVVVVKNVASNN